VHNSVFTSLGKEDDPYTVGAERCIELIQAKRKKDAEKIIRTYDENPDLKVLNGRWGPFIALGKEYFRIPKNTDASKLTFADVVQLIGGMDKYEAVIENSKLKASKKGTKAPARKSSAKTAAAKPAKKAAAKKAPAKKAAVKKAPVKKAAKKATGKK
jgi:DNA topoisomerase-1